MIKIAFIFVVTLGSSFAFAQDMSKSEDWRTAYRDTEDGGSVYVGKCQTHEDYDKVNFEDTKVLVPYFEPGYENGLLEIPELKVLEKSLLLALIEQVGGEDTAFDDLTIYKSTMLGNLNNNLDLYHINAGVGGGNGMHLFFNRKADGTYELISVTMDSDVEYCDAKVWGK